MSFFSFNEKFYEGKILEFENKTLSAAELYEVKRLLKVLDDLADEGYTALNIHLEEKLHCISRLRMILSAHGELPFETPIVKMPNVRYGDCEYEVGKLADELIVKADCRNSFSDDQFLREILDYSEWIGYDTDTSYVFLLRDALLPYIYFRSRKRKNIYPWLISRSFLRQMTGDGSVDDAIRLPIYEALENGITDFMPFKEFCREKILSVLKRYPTLEQALKELLETIHTPKIVVVESGYCGTVPLLLSALDGRVDLRLYTTAPFLYTPYREKIFCRRYEMLRCFERLYCQDVLMKYSFFKDGRFYVKLTDDANVTVEALDEIRSVMP